MSEILDATGDERGAAVARAAEVLRRGELVAVPTDTVYGVAADAFSRTGTRRLREAKGRPRHLPLSVFVRSPKQLNGLVTTVPRSAERLMAAYWPGPLTIVVPADPNLAWDIGRNEGTVAVRMPLDDVTLDLIRAVGPLAVSSANRAGQSPAGDAAAAQRELGDALRYVLDAGPRRASQPSTIVDLTRSSPQVLRAGPVNGEQALGVANGEIDPLDAEPPVAGPGATDEPR